MSAAHRGNAVQLVVHLATDKLPPYPGARDGDWNGLQSHVDHMDQLTQGFLAAEAGRRPDPPPTYCFTPSVDDDSFAPAGQHTVYLACPSAPYDVQAAGRIRPRPSPTRWSSRSRSTRQDAPTASLPGRSARRR